MAMPTFSAGQRLTAATLQQLSTQIDSLTNPGWTSYTPTWGGTGNSLGNGTLSGRYRRSANSDLVLVEVKMAIGSTTVVGTGSWTWSLPITASAAAVSGGTGGSAQVTNSGDISQPCFAVIATTTLVAIIAGPWPNTSTTINNRGGQVGATTPFAFGTSDSLAFTIAYDV